MKNFLRIDNSRFGKFKFKSHSGELRLGVISSAQYSKNCLYLPAGENLQNIFDELLVLAHLDFGGFERAARTTTRKNKKSAWRSSSCQVAWTSRPTGQQVRSSSKVSSHQGLHVATTRSLKYLSPPWAGAATSMSLLSPSSFAWATRQPGEALGRYPAQALCRRLP